MITCGLESADADLVGEDVRFEGGRVRVAGGDYAFAEAAAMTYQARVSLSAAGFYATPRIVWDRDAGTITGRRVRVRNLE